MTEKPPHPYAPSPPRVWEYTLPGGFQVLAGKTDADNDRLSLNVAGPNDWWFHVRGMPGSHVVLRVDKNQPSPDRETLNRAAAIAAYHSKARGGGVVAVSGTLAGNVSKPRGARPGSVVIRKERVFKVRPCLPAAAAEPS